MILPNNNKRFFFFDFCFPYCCFSIDHDVRRVIVFAIFSAEQSCSTRVLCGAAEHIHPPRIPRPGENRIVLLHARRSLVSKMAGGGVFNFRNRAGDHTLTFRTYIRPRPGKSTRDFWTATWRRNPSGCNPSPPAWTHCSRAKADWLVASHLGTICRRTGKSWWTLPTAFASHCYFWTCATGNRSTDSVWASTNKQYNCPNTQQQSVGSTRPIRTSKRARTYISRRHTYFCGPQLVRHANARVPMPAHVNGGVVTLCGARRFAAVHFGQQPVAIAIVAHHVVRRTYYRPIRYHFVACIRTQYGENRRVWTTHWSTTGL